MKRPAQPLQIPRRWFLATTGAATLSALTACSFLQTDPAGTGSSTSGNSAAGLLEPPELTARVEAGELPPMADRLPVRPMVIEPVEETGTYGGRLRNALLGPADVSRLTYLFSYDENLVRWDAEWQTPVPNVAEAIEASSDGRQFVFRLREGMRWSDGEPFTTSDIDFAFNDVLMNPEVYPAPPAVLAPGGVAATLSVESETAFTIAFAEPNTLFLAELANMPAGSLTRLPRHTLEAFHGAYSEDADEAAQEAGAESWQAYLQDVDNIWGGYWQRPETPRLHAWLPTGPLGDASRISFERNPYYWKVDAVGAQLPYLDGVVFDVVNDVDVLTIKTTAGELDLMERHVTTLDNKPVLADSREAGGYHFLDLVSDKVNTLCVMLNLTSQDPVKREVFGDKQFRIALSHAIDRQQIIDIVYRGQGEPWQVAPNRESEYFDEQMATQYLDFDLDLANSLLDEAGYADRGDDGIRLGPTGAAIRFTIDVSSPAIVDAVDMICTGWREIGVLATVNAIESTLGTERRNGNLLDASVTDGNGGLDVVLTPQYYLPTLPVGYAPAWGTWHATGGADGSEPPPPVLEQLELYGQVRSAVDAQARSELMRQVLAIARDEFPLIGVSSPGDGYAVVGDELKNLPPRSFFAASYPIPGSWMPEQLFLHATD